MQAVSEENLHALKLRLFERRAPQATRNQQRLEATISSLQKSVALMACLVW